MSQKKSIYNLRSNDDIDGFSYSPCFQVSPLIEPKEVPTTGEEYLLNVIKERQNCAIVTKCNIDYSKFAKNQSCFVQEIPHAKAPDKLKPTIEWQNVQVADFSEVRMYLSRIKAKKSLLPSKIKKVKIDSGTLHGWKCFFFDYEPTLSYILGLKQGLLDKGLTALIEILNEVEKGGTVDHKTGQWIYAFLACTQHPFLSHTASILRNLSRKCAEIRSHINPEEEDAHLLATPLNIFICLVAKYFAQADLAD